MLLKPTLFATLLGSSVAYAQLPQSSEALGAYANHVNSNGSSTPYRPFQVRPTLSKKRRQQSQEDLRVVTWA